MTLIDTNEIIRHWRKIELQEWGIEKFLEEVFKSPTNFYTSYEYHEESLEIPAFLEFNDTIQSLVKSKNKITSEAGKYNSEPVSDRIARKKNLKEELLTIFHDLENLFSLIRQDIFYYLKEESNFNELKIKSISYFLEQDLDDEELIEFKKKWAIEGEKIGEFQHDLFALVSFWNKIIHGVDIEKVVSDLGKLPDHLFVQEVRKHDPKDYYEISYEGASAQEHREQIEKKVAEIQEENQKNLKSRLWMYVIHTSTTDGNMMPISYDAIKQNEKRIKEEKKNRNVLYRIEKIQDRAIKKGVEYLAIQYSLSSSFKKESSSKLNKDTLKMINSFSESYSAKGNVKYTANSISTFLKIFERKKSISDRSKIIEKAKDECDELKKASRGTFDNWVVRWNSFLTDAQEK